MKRWFTLIFIFVTLAFSMAACNMIRMNQNEVKTIPKTTNNSLVKEPIGNDPEGSDLKAKGDMLQADTEEYAKNIIQDRANEVINAISAYDMVTLSQAVHPQKGVRFTPYAYVDIENDLVFLPEEVKVMASEAKVNRWGSYDGTGEAIELSFIDYFDKFVYDVGFDEAEQIGYNKILGSGNTLNNSFEVYKNAIIVEYYFSGFDPKYDGMDWRSLRLVFEKLEDTWYLVGIIHDQWTI